MILDWSARALRDMNSIEDYWRPRDPELVRDLAVYTDQALDFLLVTPGAGTPCEPPGLRRWRIGPTPFLLLYRIERNRLRIVRVRHQRTDWRRRN